MAAICGVVGILVTRFFVRELDGSDLAMEDERFRAYLVKSGWAGAMGEGDLKAEAEAGVRVSEEDGSGEDGKIVEGRGG